MKNWIKLNEVEYNEIFNFLDSIITFRPHAENNIVNLPMPNKVFDVSKNLGTGNSEEIYNDLHNKVLSTLQEITPQGDYVYALDWQHDCYLFDPFKEIDINEFEEWLVSPFPNGDIVFFITKDRKNFYVADGIKMTIYISGENLINQFLKQRPLIL